jgi:hypothetical protein
MTDDGSLPAKVSASFQQLKAAATQLNAISDKLGKSISALDAALQRFNLGVETWVRISTYSEDDGNYYFREIGYAKVGPKWGIALRTRQGHAEYPEGEHLEQWLFNDAPRALRVDAVDKLPELLEGLVKTASTTTEKIKDKIDLAQQVVAAIADSGPTGPRK